MKTIVIMMLLVLAALPVMAQGKYSIKEMTPAVQEALNHRRDRFDALKALKATGAVGENNQGYVVVLADAPNAKATVDAENRDRRVIYKTIAQQNEIPDQIGAIESVFGSVQREKAQSGEKVQDEQGQWITK